MTTQSENDIPKLTRWTEWADPRWIAAGLAILGIAIVAVIRLSGPEPLPDFDAIEDIPTRKQTFFEYLAPIVRDQNDAVRQQRKHLLEILADAEAGEAPGWLDRRWLKQLSAEYDVEWDAEAPLANADTLKQRVDVVPVALALVQAATESGWGRSRFAVEGNNLFGHWCFETGCGIVPSRRNSGAAHEVAAFDSVRESVGRYLYNLNTHAAYDPLRSIRARLRAADRKPTAMALADGLERYSERRGAYVEEIKTVLRVNQPLLERVGASL